MADRDDKAWLAMSPQRRAEIDAAKAILLARFREAYDDALTKIRNNRREGRANG